MGGSLPLIYSSNNWLFIGPVQAAAGQKNEDPALEKKALPILPVVTLSRDRYG